VRSAAFTVGTLAAWSCGVPVSAWAQNSPPKPESDCGVTTMCLRDPAVTSHGHAPSWLVALVLLAVVVVVLAVAYRFVVARHAND